ncbi:uncharacterized protein RAG0_12384 [Rhynchosporium agropyri]|uniref:Uncharacterized protein n=1 Tax=Rhynchosporium agropyri TaxID=914238 RepID=A0A1E1L840_9HELO|nr:uncharacterized protein RAG0_12384 [Rhynchosporium agropyri]
MVEIIREEDALQTALVALELENIEGVTRMLVQYLRDLNPGSKGHMRQIAHHFIHGTKEEEKLAVIMSDFSRTKFNLSLRVQLANVGLTQMVQNTVIANVEVVNRIDRRLGEVAGGTYGLKLACLVKDGQPNGPNLVTINKFDIASMGLEGMEEFDNEITFDNEGFDRIIAGNTAKDSAIQLLGPIGKDLWEDMRVRIENNRASGFAAQFAYPTDFATFKCLLDHQERMANRHSER